MESLWLFICFVTAVAELNYEETDFDDLVDNDIVRIKYSLHDTYLRDDGDGTISASATLANSDYFLWVVDTSTIQYGTTFQNVATDKYLKAKTTGKSCFTNTICGTCSGNAASWNSITTNKLKNYKNQACCSVESSDDDDIQWDTLCDNDNQNVVFERRVSNVYFAVNTRTTADLAATWCEILGATLATITSEEDNEEVYDLCASILPTNDDGCWIGLNDMETEGTPQWRDGTTYSDDSYTRLQLNNDKSHVDCVQIRVMPNTVQDKNWQYMPCNDPLYLKPFICIAETINPNIAQLVNWLVNFLDISF